MGRSVTADPSVQAHAEAAVQARTGAEVGALVGRVAAGRDLVLQAIRAPERDGVEPVSVTAGSSASSAGKKGGGGKAGKAPAGSGGAGLQLDEDWVLEHAAMLERILPGGLDIVGFYVLCPAAAFVGAAAALAGLVCAASKELSGARDLPSLLVLHMDSVTGALTLREAGFGQLRPADVKLAGVADQMVTLQSRCELDLHLPVTDGQQELQAAFQAATDAAATRLRGALGLIGGRLAGPDVQLADLAAGGSSGPISVELLLQPASSLAFCTAAGGKAGSGLLHGRAEGSAAGGVALAGALDCRACVHRREPAAAAVDALRADIKRSLQARMDALLDAAEQQEEAAAAEQQAQQAQQRGGAGGAAAPPAAPPPQHPLFVPAGSAGKPLAVSLPCRAFVASAAAGRVPYSDYLFEGESSQAMLGRLQMLLPWPELAGAAVECLETAAPAAVHTGSTAARAGGAKAAQGGTGQAGSSGSGAAALPCTLVTAASMAAAALALAVGYLSLGGSQ
ncbi:hypothetical protein ABPG75_001339 [Micractinium tetrahymenae]